MMASNKAQRLLERRKIAIVRTHSMPHCSILFKPARVFMRIWVSHPPKDGERTRLAMDLPKQEVRARFEKPKK